MRDCNKKSICPFRDHTKKKDFLYKEQDPDKVEAYRQDVAGIAPEQIAYVDETGIDTYLYREYGYAPKGQKVHCTASGRKYKRVGIVAAQLDGKIISPLEYSGTMDSSLFEAWFEEHLIPSLPMGTVIVMDNATFHRKARLARIALEHRFHLVFLPPYSPQLNPMERFWARLKRHLQSTLSYFSSFDAALFEAFQVC